MTDLQYFDILDEFARYKTTQFIHSCLVPIVLVQIS